MDRLRGVSKAPAVLVGAHPPQRVLETPLAVVLEVLAEPLLELARGDPAPVPMVEELVLQPAEEALAGRVVRAAPLRRHAPGQPVLLADRDPARPAVVPPRSLWTAFEAPSRRWARALSRPELASSASGLGPTDQATGLPSKQSTTALRYALGPSGPALNSVMFKHLNDCISEIRRQLQQALEPSNPDYKLLKGFMHMLVLPSSPVLTLNMI